VSESELPGLEKELADAGLYAYRTTQEEVEEVRNSDDPGHHRL
jgi:hypothetical protein